MTTTHHPIQPLVLDPHEVLRFKENPLVRMLVDHGQRTGLGLNELARVDVTPEDRMQLAQLIGYSLNGYGTLGYVTDEAYRAAAAMHDEELSEDKARIATLETELSALRSALREPMARLFGVHPDDLQRT
jgi:hypothetical protein